MDRDEFPLILSPNLGCPLIVEEKEFRDGSPQGLLTLIVAGRYGEFDTPVKDLLDGRLFLRPSYPDAELEEEVELIPAAPPTEIKDWNILTEFEKPDDTRELLTNILHYGVLGEETRYFRVQVKAKPKGHDPLPEIKSLLRRVNGGEPLPTLYDLVMERPLTRERVNYHSVQVVRTTKGAFQFIHLTDLHISKRNDEIVGEVLQDKQERPRDTIKREYVNFNNNVRHFIQCANQLADEGKLDFVVITGDLVDFAFHGWEYDPNPSENNWRTFIHIFTGTERERSSHGNQGIKVAIYTSTGNHDWRSYPYHLVQLGYYKEFGITKKEAESCSFRGFDLDAFLRYKKTYEKSPDMAASLFRVPSILNLGQLLGWTKPILLVFFLLIVPLVLFFTRDQTICFKQMWNDPTLAWKAVKLSYLLVMGLLGSVLAWVTKHKVFVRFIAKYVSARIGDQLTSIYAAPMSLHYYLKYVNPYLDYAFEYGSHLFVVMDTGMDYMVGEVTEKAQSQRRGGKVLSVKDNLLGGSPDSYGFDYRKLYYDWSQIVWLEKALSLSCGESANENQRRFVLLHAPPLNPDMPADPKWFEFTESRRTGRKPWYWYPILTHIWYLLKFVGHRIRTAFKGDSPWRHLLCFKWLREGKREFDRNWAWIDESECCLTYGTLNNYLSQFFYLCMGERENDVRSGFSSDHLRPVDIVFSGHAHLNIEFRVKKDVCRPDRVMRVYSDLYSLELAAQTSAPEEWWNKKRPIIVQTGGGGLRGCYDPDPPYYRRVLVEPAAGVRDFRVRRVDQDSGAERIVRREELLGGRT